jgi:16S rRNA (guanine527-N7)-methyltransferase
MKQALDPRYLQYCELLLRWQKTYNLTAIKNIDEMMTHHVQDSLAIKDFIHGKNIIDVGSGAGLPGMILAIALPDKKFTLLDAVEKKTHFMQHVKTKLNLLNVTVVHSRVEDYKPAELFDTVVTRAFSDIKQMLICTQHLLSEQGEFLAMKGKLPEEELAELPTGFNVKSVQSLTVPGLDASRHLLVIERS